MQGDHSVKLHACLWATAKQLYPYVLTQLPVRKQCKSVKYRHEVPTFSAAKERLAAWMTERQTDTTTDDS